MKRAGTEATVYTIWQLFPLWRIHAIVSIDSDRSWLSATVIVIIPRGLTDECLAGGMAGGVAATAGGSLSSRRPAAATAGGSLSSPRRVAAMAGGSLSSPRPRPARRSERPRPTDGSTSDRGRHFVGWPALDRLPARLPVFVLSKLFRHLMLEKLIAAHAAGRLQFFGKHAHLAQREAFIAVPNREAAASRGVFAIRAPSDAPRPWPPRPIRVNRPRS